jgi:ribonucleotide reductase beta subunit family protein with ferritin-like domain
MSLTKPSITYKPFIYPWAVDLAQEHEDIHWTEKEVDLKEDVKQWKAGDLTPAEKNHITQILRLFTVSDVEVGGNYYDVFIPKFKNNEVRNMLGSFAAREAIHQRAYALINDTLGFDDAEFVLFKEYKQMCDKVEFMTDNDNSTVEGLALSLAKSVFNEGVTLFASFAMLLHYQRKGKMKGMGTVVEWSIRDEEMHVRGISQLFRAYCEEHPRIVGELSLEKPIKGLDKKKVKEYIRFIADRRLIQLGLKANWHVKENPLDWLTYIINGKDHSNFFEKRVTEYSTVGMADGDMW